MTTSLLIRPSRTRLIGLEPIPLNVVEDDDLQTISLVGTVSAGKPIDIYEEAAELKIPRAWVSNNPRKPLAEASFLKKC